MFEWISLRATAAAPGPSSHVMLLRASRVRSEPWLFLKESSAFMPTLKAVTVSVPSVEASAGVEAPGEDIEGTRFWIRGSLEPERCADALVAAKVAAAVAAGRRGTNASIAIDHAPGAFRSLSHAKVCLRLRLLSRAPRKKAGHRTEAPQASSLMSVQVVLGK